MFSGSGRLAGWRRHTGTQVVLPAQASAQRVEDWRGGVGTSVVCRRPPTGAERCWAAMYDVDVVGTTIRFETDVGVREGWRSCRRRSIWRAI